MPKYPKPIGPYSVYREAGGIVFLSGQIGINPDTGKLEEGFEAQSLRVIKNVANILAEVGLGLDDVLKTTVFLKDIGDYPTFNRIYSRFFHKPYPARSVVAVKDLPAGALVEMEVIALRGNPIQEIEVGLELFKEGRFYESHELWEKAFRKLSGRDRDFLSGLVNIDAALVKYGEGNTKGTILNLQKARRKIERLFPNHRVLRELDEIITILQDGGEANFRPLFEATEEVVKEFLNAVE
ncbi:MAG: DUF309 domain-containing protein [Thermotogae bacterium]|nr:DUF309 domain-containing protein [Thermotogota bacterium]